MCAGPHRHRHRQRLPRSERVIGHEYFHNWTGNRVTCRDWFPSA
ncbi:M1 family aminopeptidase [Shigella flexneri]